MRLSSGILVGATAFTSVLANTEKTIFLGPEPILVPSTHPTIDDLALHRLTPDTPSVRTHLAATFPTTESPAGTDSWILLDNLVPGQRYEVRVCWLATQPTSFTLNSHTLDTVFSDPMLLTSLTTYSYSRIDLISSSPNSPLAKPLPPPSVSDLPSRDHDEPVSVLFLQISSAADFFTRNETMMKAPPPVHVDVILDPFVMNVFPRSLGPTAGYLVGVGVVGWIVARWVSRSIHRLGREAHKHKEKKDA